MPQDLNQTFSTVRAALGECMLTMTQLGLPLKSTDLTPNKALEEFRKLDKKGDIDQILQDLVPTVPFVLQAKVGLEQARHDMELAELNLRYCDVVSEIDGFVVGRNVNPGNNVQAGQALMAVRSLTEIWIDANFKETQLAELRIGQRVRCEVDMYGSRREFEGRITGFTMGTGQTLSLLPPQERYRQLREDRTEATGPGRVDRLRPGQVPAVRRAVCDTFRVLQGTAHGTARGGDPATGGGPSDENCRLSAITGNLLKLAQSWLGV